jgi:hypothetical protein
MYIVEVVVRGEKKEVAVCALTPASAMLIAEQQTGGIARGCERKQQ